MTSDGWSWVTFDPATGKAHAVRPLPAECEDPHTLGWFRDDLVCASDRSKLVRLDASGGQRVLDAQEGFGFVGDGVDRNLERDSSSWQDATRWVPLFANDMGTLVDEDREYHLRFCVLDLETMRTDWCARDVAQRGRDPTTLQSARRGPYHVIALAAAGGATLLTVLDGRTGKFGGALRLDFPARPEAYSLDPIDFTLEAQTLFGRAGPHAFAIGVPEMRLRWRQGPPHATVEPAERVLESILGPLPR
jgi:hypothetical protein